MDPEDNQVESEQPVKFEEQQEEQKPYAAGDFIQEYNELCEKTGFQIVVNPAFMKRDDGTFSVVLQHSVGQLPKQQ